MPVPSGAMPAPTTEMWSFPKAPQNRSSTLTWVSCARTVIHTPLLSSLCTTWSPSYPSVTGGSLPNFCLILCSNTQEILSQLCSSTLPWEIPPRSHKYTPLSAQSLSWLPKLKTAPPPWNTHSSLCFFWKAFYLLYGIIFLLSYRVRKCPKDGERQERSHLAHSGWSCSVC